VVTEGALAGTTVKLGDAPVTLGRADDSTLVLTDDYASSRHARLVPGDGAWTVEDLGSTNGTYLGGSKVTRPMPVPVGPADPDRQDRPRAAPVRVRVPGRARVSLSLRFAARSDVGLLRDGNEDSVYAGPRVLAVADGMGGHAAGEVASAVAIAALAPLDDDDPGSDLLDALRESATSANEHLRDMVSATPGLDGMGHDAHRDAVRRQAAGAWSTSATRAATCCATASSARSPPTTRWSPSWSSRGGSARTRRAATRSGR
jgi:hypothetical protein